MVAGSTSPRLDLYRTITQTVIAQIEAGAGAYRMPWHYDGSPMSRPRNAVVCNLYRGINVLALWIAARVAGYPTGLWATYRQWQLKGAQVRKGEQGTLIVFWKKLDQAGQPFVEDDDDRTEAPRRFVARGFWVFNAAQVDGFSPIILPELPESDRIVRAEEFWQRLGITTRYGGDEAYYAPTEDRIQMPPFERFRDAGSFYATLLHEGAHATGAPHRLDRDLSGRFGSEAYAMEEMIADWASCMGCMTLDLTPEPRRDHAQYIASWLKALRGDPRAVFTAASKAQQIVDWMWGRQTVNAPALSRTNGAETSG